MKRKLLGFSCIAILVIVASAYGVQQVQVRIPATGNVKAIEDEINNLIAGCNKKTSVFLQPLKETGMRCGEAFMLKWTDFDVVNRTVNITPEKGSEPRQLKISSQLISMLNSLPREKAEPFACSSRHFTRYFRSQRA